MNTPVNPPRRLIGKKLLVASFGVAALSYVGITESPLSGDLVPSLDTDSRPRPIPIPPTSGNLMPPPPPTSGNLMPPPPPTSGNLMPPPFIHAAAPVPAAAPAAMAALATSPGPRSPLRPIDPSLSSPSPDSAPSKP